MPKTIAFKLTIILQRIKISMLKAKISKMERSSYLDLCERMELKNSISLLQSLEQQQEATINSSILLFPY